LAPGQEIIWKLAERVWRLRHDSFPSNSWNRKGFSLTCGIADFKSVDGKPSPGDNRLWSILISEASNLIWKIRCTRVIERAGKDDPLHSEQEVHNNLIAALNKRLLHDRILTNKARYASLAIPESVVLKTWSGILANERNLPEQWLRESGVLVGIGPQRPPGQPG